MSYGFKTFINKKKKHMNQTKDRINKAIKFYRTFIIERKKFDASILEKTLPVFIDLVDKYVNYIPGKEADADFAETLFNDKTK